ncbi:MAG: DUF6691 family protein [Bacteroidota bacterium]
MKNLKYLLFGVLFGILLTKGEVISWFRIQEMFRFQSFHMYGFMGSAVITGFIGIQLIRWFKWKAVDGQRISLIPKELHTGVIIGGTMFGLGWALTGACPGPLYAHLGAGNGTFLVTIISAMLGTFAYGVLRPYLPHKDLMKHQSKEKFYLYSDETTDEVSYEEVRKAS